MTTDHLARLIQDSAARFSARPAMRHQVDGSWHSISYADLGTRVRAVSAALVEAGVAPGDMVGIFAPNRPEWTIADFGILGAAAVSVPIYATSTAAQLSYIVADAGISVLFVGEQSHYDKVVMALPDMPTVTHVVLFDPTIAYAEKRAVLFEDFLTRGRATDHGAELESRMRSASTRDVATLIYTSGTTGDPKGAILTHANIVHQLRALEERFDVGPDDRSLCFLPLSHAYERCWSVHVFAHGAENCYVPDPRRVVEAMAEVRPTLMVSVPRLYEKIHATVLDRVERGSALKARIFHWAMGIGARYQTRSYAGEPIGRVLAAEHAIADRLVLSSIRDVVGGEKKVFSAGGAPLSKEIEEFFFAAGLFVCQGYGLTETAALLTCNYPGGFRFGSVGSAVLGSEVRIAPADGEIQVRGGSVMAGYFGKPDDTAAAFDGDWLRTGDQGFLDADGFLHITDRIKDIIITSQGKNVAPQHVEGVLGADPYIEQIVVIGDRRSYLVALIEPAFPLLERYAEEHGIRYASHAELVADPTVRALYDARIAESSHELAGYEQVKRYSLLPRELTQEGGQLTPTLKLRRRVIERQFADEITAMYEASGRA